MSGENVAPHYYSLVNNRVPVTSKRGVGRRRFGDGSNPVLWVFPVPAGPGKKGGPRQGPPKHLRSAQVWVFSDHWPVGQPEKIGP